MTQPEWQAGQPQPQHPAPGQPIPYGTPYQQVGPVADPRLPPGPPRRTVDPAKLWAGGVATAVVAALIAVAGILIARGVLKIPVLAPKEQGTWGSASTLTYALVAFAIGLIATGLMHVLLLTTPSPFAFFGWIMGLATVVAAALPFTSGASLEAKIATAIINALIGIAIWTLTDSTGHRSLRLVPPGAVVG
jgi:hypothetical protein